MAVFLYLLIDKEYTKRALRQYQRGFMIAEAVKIERDEHYNVYKKPDIATTRYPTYKFEKPRGLDPVEQFFKYNELSKSVSSLNKWLPKNPYKNEFDAFVDDFFMSHAHLPESETLRQLHEVLEVSHASALKSLKK